MAEINPRTAGHDSQSEAILDSILTDIDALRTAFNTAMTKLNADAGVTDTNYAAAPALTTTT